MIKAKSREHRNEEILINENKILYVVPSINGETVVYFDKINFLVLTENYDEFIKRFEAKLPTAATFSPAQSIVSTSKSDISEYPEDIPRLPNGNIDKRTTAYKEYTANLQIAK